MCEFSEKVVKVAPKHFNSCYKCASVASGLESVLCWESSGDVPELMLVIFVSAEELK